MSEPLKEFFGHSAYSKQNSLRVEQGASALAVDFFGQKIALACSNGLHLRSLLSPSDRSFTISHRTLDSPNYVACKWCPHVVHSHRLASITSRSGEVWDVVAASSRLYGILCDRHLQEVRDLSWSDYDPHTLATCGLGVGQNCICIYDMREDFSAKATHTFDMWSGSASRVLFNPKNPFCLVSVHSGEVRVWDLRKDSAVHLFTPHVGNVVGIDWSPFSHHVLATCGEDQVVSIWDVHATEPLISGTLGENTTSVSFLPFSKGIVVESSSGMGRRKGNRILKAYSITNETDFEFIGSVPSQSLDTLPLLTQFRRVPSVIEAKEAPHSFEEIENSYEIISYESTGIIRRHLLLANIEALQQQKGVGRKKMSLGATVPSSLTDDIDVGVSEERKMSSLSEGKHFTSLIEELDNIQHEMGLDVVEESVSESPPMTAQSSVDTLRFSASSADLMGDDADAGKLEGCRIFKIATPWEDAYIRMLVPAAYPAPNAPLVSFFLRSEKEIFALTSVRQFVLQLNRSAMLSKMHGKCYIKAFLDGFLLSLPQFGSSDFFRDSKRMFPSFPMPSPSSSSSLDAKWDSKQGKTPRSGSLARTSSSRSRSKEKEVGPRVCGAVFSPSGPLVHFSNVGQSRSIGDVGSTSSTGSVLGLDLADERQFMNLQVQTKVAPPGGSTIPSGRSQIGHASMQRKSLNRQIYLRFYTDVHSLRMKKLAHKYVFVTSMLNAWVACERNRRVARDENETDSAHVWEIAAEIVKPIPCSRQFLSTHPLGVNFLHDLIDARLWKRDIQTAAMLICMIRMLALEERADGMQTRYDVVLFMYSDLLLLWNLMNERTVVHACMSTESSQSYTVPEVIREVGCGPSQSSLKCVICGSRVHGLCLACLHCGHGGHLEHMLEWFSDSSRKTCPNPSCSCTCYRYLTAPPIVLEDGDADGDGDDDDDDDDEDGDDDDDVELSSPAWENLRRRGSHYVGNGDEDAKGVPRLDVQMEREDE